MECCLNTAQAKTYRTHSYLQLQLHTGRRASPKCSVNDFSVMGQPQPGLRPETWRQVRLYVRTGVLLREYFVVSHGWLPPARRTLASKKDQGLCHSLQDGVLRSEVRSLLRWTMMPKRPVQVSAKPH